MKKIRPNIWFNFNAEEAMDFYKSVFPDFEELGVQTTPVDTPGPKAGDVVIVIILIYHNFNYSSFYLIHFQLIL